MGRPSNWNHSPTELIRVPKALIGQILEHARFLDELPEAEGFV